jgi:hypothetical protein
VTALVDREVVGLRIVPNRTTETFSSIDFQWLPRLELSAVQVFVRDYTAVRLKRE